jgi:hypothetical protein
MEKLKRNYAKAKIAITAANLETIEAKEGTMILTPIKIFKKEGGKWQQA